MYYALSSSGADRARILRLLCAHIVPQLQQQQAREEEERRGDTGNSHSDKGSGALSGLQFLPIPAASSLGGRSGAARFSVLYPNRNDLSGLFVEPARHRLASAVADQDSISSSYWRKFCPVSAAIQNIPGEISVAAVAAAGAVDTCGNMRELVALLERVELQWRRLCR